MGINLFIIHYITSTYYGLLVAFEITVHFIRLIEHYDLHLYRSATQSHSI